MSEITHGSFIKLTATFECGGCGKSFRVESDDAGGTEKVDMFDHLVDIVRGGGFGFDGSTSVQHGYILCTTCTWRADSVVPDGEERNATALEVRRIFADGE